MDEMNCVGIHCFAEAHSCKMLEKRSMEYILEHFSSVCQQVKCRWKITVLLLLFGRPTAIQGFKKIKNT